MSLACLVMPKDLLNLVRLQPGHCGSLLAHRSNHDHVYLVVELRQTGHDISSKFDFVSRHARIDNPESEVLWFKVRAGFARALSRGLITSLGALQAWFLNDGRGYAIGPLQLSLFLEPDGKASCAWVLNADNKPFSIFQEKLSILEPQMDLSEMHDGLVPVHELASKHVVVVGAGSGGGQIAVQLAAAGIGQLTLIDPDRLEPGNVFRHVCGLEYVGCYKIDAVKQLIENKGLRTRVSSLRVDILVDTAPFFDAVKAADLIVCASDTKQSRALANFAAVSLQKPFVAVCAYDGATVGEILVYQKGLPCLECVRTALRKAGALEPDNSVLPVPDVESYRTETIKLPHSRGTRADVTIIASLATKVCLLALIAGKRLMAHLPASYIVWGGTKNNSRAAPFRFSLPMSVQYVPVHRQDKCPICGDHLRELEKRYEERLSEFVSD